VKSGVSVLLRAASIAALAFAFAAFSGLTHASAHASYDHSSPSDKQVLATPPAALTITFVENILPSPGTFAMVSNGDTTVSASPGTVSTTDTKTLVVPLNGGLKPGKYDVF
jgi:methionine-rich copper-binding protein CopC